MPCMKGGGLEEIMEAQLRVRMQAGLRESAPNSCQAHERGGCRVEDSTGAGLAMFPRKEEQQCECVSE